MTPDPIPGLTRTEFTNNRECGACNGNIDGSSGAAPNSLEGDDKGEIHPTCQTCCSSRETAAAAAAVVESSSSTRGPPGSIPQKPIAVEDNNEETGVRLLHMREDVGALM